MNPSKKSDEVEDTLKKVFNVDRRDSISKNLCIPAPIGCGQPITLASMTLLERKEYTISGLCEKCQRIIFGPQEGTDEKS